MKIFKNLFGNGSKIHADEIVVGTENKNRTLTDEITSLNTNLDELEKGWVRVDTLSSPLLITGTTYDNPTIVPLNIGYASNNGRFYAIELSSYADRRDCQVVIFKHSLSGSGGSLMIAVGTVVAFVNRIKVSSNPNALGLYGASRDLYVGALYIVKDFN